MTTFAAQRARLAAAAAAAQPRPLTTYAVAQARFAAQPRQTLRAVTARRARLDRKVAEIALRLPFAK